MSEATECPINLHFQFQDEFKTNHPAHGLEWNQFEISLPPLSFAGLLTCLNHEDCLGANRYCHRNRTMTSGVCACNGGYKQAKDSAIKCLNVGECKQAG